MMERCDDLDRFFDRELELEADQAFRDHLAGCNRCQDVLLGRMLEIAVVAEARTSRPSYDPLPPELIPSEARPADDARSDAPAEVAAAGDEPTQLRLWRRRRRVMLVAAAVLPLAAAVALWIRILPDGGLPSFGAKVAVRDNADSHRSPAIDLTASLAAERRVEVRFSDPALDRHRRLLVMRAADETAADRSEPIQHAVLTELEHRGQRNALVGANALAGNVSTAQRIALALPRSAAALSDRAALELLGSTPAIDPGLRGAAVAGSSARVVATNERALSLASDALRLEPGLQPATWNQAIALRRLGLTLAAAVRFEEIAKRHEPGWSDEAADAAAKLRRDHQSRTDDWQQVVTQLDAMAAGGPVIGETTLNRAPSPARDALYLAVATAATPERIDALAPLAHQLDAKFETTALGELVAAVRRSNLAARAPLAAELRAVLALPAEERAARLAGLPARAEQRGVRDIALAALLAVPERKFDDGQLALLDKLVVGSRDDWWKIVALARRAYRLEFAHRDYAGVYAAERRAEQMCRKLASRWCQRIELLSGGASSQMGRADLALDKLASALRAARNAQLPTDEADALEQLGQAIAIRVAGDLDSAAVAGAYLEDVALRKGRCASRLQRLDFAANAALQHHRLGEAARMRDEADALERGECNKSAPRLNGETARLRLVLRGSGSLDTLRANVATLDAATSAGHKLYVEFLAAGVALAEDRARGAAALRKVIDAATADRSATYASDVRGPAFDALVDSAAASGDAAAVIGLVTERLGAPRLERCALAVASWNRLVVAALDSAGRAQLDVREVPEGAVMIPPRDVVSPALRARLAGCVRIDVVASGPYFGAARLLDDRIAWSYRAGPAHAPTGPTAAREIVVSDVAPPRDLQLPALQPFTGSAGAQILSGVRATPANVLAAMTTASLAIIVAHGITDAQEPTAASLILSPDAQGDYLLTASKVGAAKLTGAPVVVLAGCDAGRVQVSAEPWSLATSFLEAGARVVIAPTEPIPDADAGGVFRSLIERIRGGANPADALVAERSTLITRSTGTDWLSSIVVFE